MSAVRLCVVRHGETAWNAEGRVQGQTDVPLNEVGRTQALAVAGALGEEPFDAVYSSDLVRVRDTALPSAAALGLPIAVDAALRERHYGMFETLTYAEAKTRFPDEYGRFRDKDLDFDFGTGESLRSFARRALEGMRAIAERHAEARILVFTHGGVLEMLYREATGRGLISARDFEIPNAAINRFEYAGGAWSLTAWAERDHLANARDDLPG